MGNKNTQMTNLAVNTEADAFAALLNSGFIDLLTGVQPATGDTALSGNTLLASPIFNATAFAASAAGVISANAITAAAAVAGGKCTFARLYKSDHTTKVMDASVGMKLTGADFTFTSGTKQIVKAGGGFNSTNLLVGDQIVISGSGSNNGTFTIATLPNDTTITVNEAIVTEAPGANVTLQENKNIILTNVNIVLAASVSISSFSHLVAKATTGA